MNTIFAISIKEDLLEATKNSASEADRSLSAEVRCALRAWLKDKNDESTNEPAAAAAR